MKYIVEMLYNIVIFSLSALYMRWKYYILYSVMNVEQNELVNRLEAAFPGVGNTMVLCHHGDCGEVVVHDLQRTVQNVF